MVEPDKYAIYPSAECRLGKPRADVGSHAARRDWGVEDALGSVWQRDGWHGGVRSPGSAFGEKEVLLTWVILGLFLHGGNLVGQIVKRGELAVFAGIADKGDVIEVPQ